jgi:hypothetical protein
MALRGGCRHCLSSSRAAERAARTCTRTRSRRPHPPAPPPSRRPPSLPQAWQRCLEEATQCTAAASASAEGGAKPAVLAVGVLQKRAIGRRVLYSHYTITHYLKRAIGGRAQGRAAQRETARTCLPNRPPP